MRNYPYSLPTGRRAGAIARRLGISAAGAARAVGRASISGVDILTLISYLEQFTGFHANDERAVQWPQLGRFPAGERFVIRTGMIAGVGAQLIESQRNACTRSGRLALMNIGDESTGGESQSESRKLELFADRCELTYLFASYLNDANFRKTILYFYGEGGNGKSLLLKFLLQKCCKRFSKETWQQLRSRAVADVPGVAASIAATTDWEEITSVPAVLLDFGMQPRGDDQPQDPFYGPLMLRRNLSIAARDLNYHVQFPYFDFACLWYLHKKGKSQEEIKSLLPTEEMELLGTITDALSNTAWATLIRLLLQRLTQHLSEPMLLSWARRKLDEGWFDRLQTMAPDTELIDELPRWLARDLNSAIASETLPPGLVLFFDTHEAFWGEQRNLPEEKIFYLDEWLRRFLSALELESGIVAVVAGRELPQWAVAAKAPIPGEYLDTHRVENLPAADAIAYLQKVGIGDIVLAEALVNCASVRPGQVHPLYLGLCADAVLAAKKRDRAIAPQEFTEFAATFDRSQQSKELIHRFLRYVDRETAEAIHSLSACRAFDFSLYRKLGEELHFTATRAGFNELTRLSFVWRSEQRGENWYRLHNLLCRLDLESGNATTLAAHRVLEQHYRASGEVAEAIYHASCLNWQPAVEEWVEELEASLKASRFDRCRQLLEIRSELTIRSDFFLGKVAAAEGHYFGRLARYDEACQKYEEAIAALERFLRQEPDRVDAWNALAIALARLGDMHGRLSQHGKAQHSYRESLKASQKALEVDSENFVACSYRGIAFRRLGELQAKLSQVPEALRSYAGAIAAYKQALRLRKDDADLLNIIGNALIGWGDLLVSAKQHKEAHDRYRQAIAASQKALGLNANSAYARHNQGNACRGLAELLAKLHQRELVLPAYQQAIAAFDSALEVASDYVYARQDKGRTLQSLGEWHWHCGQVAEALDCCREAIASFDQALLLAPDSTAARYSKGLALKKLGEFYSQSEQAGDARVRWQAALAEFDRCLEIAPENQEARHQKESLMKLLQGLVQ